MKKGQTNPASLTSKRLLASALVELMEEKDYKSITITELCERSTVARRTFYRNFEQIDDILYFYTGDIIEAFKTTLTAKKEDTFYDILISYFNFWLPYQDIITLLSKDNLTHILFMQYLESLRDLPFLCGLDDMEHHTLSDINCRLTFTAGGLWSLLTYWCLHCCVESPKHLAHIVLNQ